MNTKKPSIDLWSETKKEFKRRGLSFSRWCRENEMDYSNMRKYVCGYLVGPTPTKRVEQVLNFLNVVEPEYKVDGNKD